MRPSLGVGYLPEPSRRLRVGDAFAAAADVRIYEGHCTYRLVARCASFELARRVARMLNRDRGQR